MMLRAILERSLACVLLWWILTEGRLDGWGVGLVSIGLAVAASLHLMPPTESRFSWLGLFGFIVFFLHQSASGGIQVAARALRPEMNLAPALIELRFGLPPGPARVLLAYTLNLLPGTLTAVIAGDTLRLHVLDRRMPIAEEVRMAEMRIARMLRVEA
jgi:multicomponent Na+:H+ antiporter subunit E